MIEGAMITGGICFSYWINFAFFWTNPNSVSWRCPIALQIVPAFILLACIPQLPESPRWLILKGQDDEALTVISSLADLDRADHLVAIEFTEIRDTVLEVNKFRWSDLFVMGPDRNFHRVVLGFVNQVCQQISGINLITYYATVIYEQHIGLTDVKARIMAACNGTEYFLASFFAVYTIEKFGRRQLMLCGAMGMSGSMAILAAMEHTSEVGIGGQKPGIVSAVFLFVFNSFFAVGWLGMTCKLVHPFILTKGTHKLYRAIPG